MKVKELIKKLENDGWIFVRQTGSHKHFKKSGVMHIITVPDHGVNEEVRKGLLHKIEKQAGWE
jgi:predicted RNA binding protein YcfA (HicA-like mRNA interferase family)